MDVGCGKGKVNLIDLPSDLASACRNPSALLFSLNKLLAEYRRHAIDEENAAAGRKLLADQAHAVAEMLKHLALSQSAPVGKHLEAERELRNSLASAGIACEEVFIGGEMPDIYITAAGNISAAAIRTAAERALGIPLILSSKSALNAEKYCYFFRKKPAFDAAFGIASRTKDGESAAIPIPSSKSTSEPFYAPSPTAWAAARTRGAFRTLPSPSSRVFTARGSRATRFLPP